MTNRTWPAYVGLYESGELARRVDEAVAALGSCRICPRHCEVDRLANQTRVCHSGRLARVSSFFAHFGEEDCLRGTRGSGTIFFGFCNLKCVFCQNHDTSQDGLGPEVTAEQLAAMMIDLQGQGCHNINWVTPEHVVPQALEGLLLAVERGLRIPLVYNTSGYDSLESLRWLDGLVDIYMPDFKLWERKSCARYLKAKDYREVTCEVIRAMHAQVGDLEVDDRGLARRGLLIRHLVMPGLLDETRQILRWLAEEVSPATYVNVMGQYYPDYQAAKFEEINRRPTAEEMRQAIQHFHDAGLTRLDERRPRTRLPLFG